MAFPVLSKKGTSQPQRLTLDQSELLVLKELASFFLSVDFHGSQLEALLRARPSQDQASLLEYNTDEITASILTPSPTSKSEANVDAQAIWVPSQASPTPQPSPPSVLEPPEAFNGIESASTSTGPILLDRAFEHCVIDGTGSTQPVVIDNFSHCNVDAKWPRVKTSAFSHSIIRGVTVNNHVWNANADCITLTNSPQLV